MRQKGPQVLGIPRGLDEITLAVDPHPVRDVSGILGAFIEDREDAAEGMEIGVCRLVDLLNVQQRVALSVTTHGFPPA